MKEIEPLMGKKIGHGELDFAFPYATVVFGWLKIRDAYQAVILSVVR